MFFNGCCGRPRVLKKVRHAIDLKLAANRIEIKESIRDNFVASLSQRWKFKLRWITAKNQKPFGRQGGPRRSRW